MDDRKVSTPQADESRRDVVKKMAYAAPLVLSLVARPAFASSGSCGCPERSSTRRAAPTNAISPSTRP